MSSRHVAALGALAVAALFVLPTANAESRKSIEDRFAPEQTLDVIQPGCTTFLYEGNPCHAIATMMNGLDTPKIDVLILVPVSPFAERDMRIMRQSVEMWEDGVRYLSKDMGLDWMVDGVEFHIAVEMINTGESEFTTYPIVDPEIVVVATNPVGGIGIGIDPIDFAGQLFGESPMEGPCHGVANPFDLPIWEALPGFNDHHGGRGGTYVEDCGGAGGNICFSVNGAVDPDTATIDFFQLYDLVSHETGHCLSLGHVGDGAEGAWSSVPTNDIMSYNSDPPGLSKCVSTLNVEGLAVAMSRYLDVNGDGAVTTDDYLFANDAVGEGDGRPFQVQHPDNHYYASPTGKAMDCPQPDMGLVPLMEVVNFTPVKPSRAELSINGVWDLKQVAQGRVNLNGWTNGTGADHIELSAILAPDGNSTKPEYVTENLTVPLRADGTWSGNLDLSGVSDGAGVILAARWLDAEGNLVDADRVAAFVDAGAAVDKVAVAAADAGPGANQVAPQDKGEESPAPMVPALLLVVIAAAAMVRRKP